MSGTGDLVSGRYRLEERVGSGAMGVVWRATDERLQRQVAVKQLLLQEGLDPARSEEARLRAMREGRVAARLNHPNAIGVFDVVVDDGLPVLVMEYLPSRSLAEILAQRGSLPPATVSRIGAQAASALAAAHAAGVVHRDIKPGNILIAHDGTAKITDFGISHAAGDVAITQTGMVAGTPAYLAPEVARGHKPAPSSDMFSLGATLYAAVEGAPPFGGSGENSLALLHKVAAGNVPPPRQAGPLTPVLETMLAVDASQRLTAAQAGEALLAIADGRPVPAAVEAAATEVWPTRALPPAGTVPFGAAQGPAATMVDGTAIAPEPNRTMVGHAPAEQEPRTRRRLLPFLLAGLAVLLLGGIGLYALLAADDDPQGPRTASLTPRAMEETVSRYYTHLPDEAEQAWELLGPALQSQGKQNYLDRWSDVSTVEIRSDPRATGDDTVAVGIELVLSDGTTITQSHELTLISSNTTLLINGDKMIQAETVVPTSSEPEHTPEETEKPVEPKPEQTTTEETTETTTTTVEPTEEPTTTVPTTTDEAAPETNEGE